MGSISSRPQAPATQQPVIITVPQPVYEYVPAPVTPVTPVTTPPADSGSAAGGGTTPVTTAPISEEAKSAARAEGLLNRNRGLLGTVMTSFRGLLNQTGNGTRKTLLGE